MGSTETICAPVTDCTDVSGSASSLFNMPLWTKDDQSTFRHCESGKEVEVHYSSGPLQPMVFVPELLSLEPSIWISFGPPHGKSPGSRLRLPLFRQMPRLCEREKNCGSHPQTCVLTGHVWLDPIACASNSISGGCTIARVILVRPCYSSSAVDPTPTLSG